MQHKSSTMQLADLLLTTYYLLFTTYYLLLTTFYFLLSRFYVLRSTFYVLLSTFYFLPNCSLPHAASLPSPRWCRIYFVFCRIFFTLRAVSSGTGSVCLSCTPAAFRKQASWVILTQ